MVNEDIELSRKIIPELTISSIQQVQSYLLSFPCSIKK